MKSIALNLMGVEADTIKCVSIDNDIDGEGETKEVIEVTTRSGDNFEFETKYDFGEICLAVKGPNGPMMVLKQGPSIKRSLRTISGVSSIEGTGDEFVAETNFGPLFITINKFIGIMAFLKAEKAENTIEFRVWASNPHE